MNMKSSIIIVTLLIILSTSACEKKETSSFPEPDTNYPELNDEHQTFDGYRLKWHDEFNASTVDETKWNYDSDSTGNSQGWGNSELQYYTDRSGSNAYIDNDTLVIAAKSESAGGKSYTSARLHTDGNYSVQYGVIEARILLPSNSSGNTDAGTWPAFWMLGDNFDGWGHSKFGGTTNWPASGEIDIMESNYKDFGYMKVSSAVHFDNRSTALPYDRNHWEYRSENAAISNATKQYHIYSIKWTDASMQFYLDHQEFFTYNIEQEEFNKPFFILLNLAVGGHFPGTPNPSLYPQKMHVDWVRVYQQ